MSEGRGAEFACIPVLCGAEVASMHACRRSLLACLRTSCSQLSLRACMYEGQGAESVATVCSLFTLKPERVPESPRAVVAAVKGWLHILKANESKFLFFI